MASKVRGTTALERAMNKAMAQNTPVYCLDDGAYTVPGSGDSVYTVEVEGNRFTCSCTAGARGIPCYHAAAVMMEVTARRLEARAAAAQAREASPLVQPVNRRSALYGAAA